MPALALATCSQDRAVHVGVAQLVGIVDGVVLGGHERDCIEAELQADADFHLSIYRACHNAVMAFVMTTLITMQRRDVFYDRLSTFEQPSTRKALMEQHRALYLAIMNRQPDLAAEAAETHIRFASRTLRESMETASRLQVSLRRRKRATSPDGSPFSDDEKPPARRRKAKPKEN